jgi:tRNA pseudouridine38-40 synthase
MRNVLFTLAFEGTRYHGFQVQQNALSVCEAFQDACGRILGGKPDVKGCSRTDAGVHANMYCLSMKLDSTHSCRKLMAAFNHVLPEDIAVLDIQEVPLGFHARYSCTGKEYLYRIHNSHVKDPFSPKLSYQYARPLDCDALNEEAQGFVGTHDFSAFCSAGAKPGDPVRTISAFKVAREGEKALFYVSGNGFLYNMARIMVGTLVYISAGRIPRGSVADIIASRDRSRAGKTMPAQGLTLNKVFYGEQTNG